MNNKNECEECGKPATQTLKMQSRLLIERTNNHGEGYKIGEKWRARSMIYACDACIEKAFNNIDDMFRK